MKKFNATATHIFNGHVLVQGTAKILSTITSGPVGSMTGRTVEIEITKEQALLALKKMCRKDDIAAAIAELENHLATQYPA